MNSQKSHMLVSHGRHRPDGHVRSTFLVVVHFHMGVKSAWELSVEAHQQSIFPQYCRVFFCRTARCNTCELVLPAVKTSQICLLIVVGRCKRAHRSYVYIVSRCPSLTADNV